MVNKPHYGNGSSFVLQTGFHLTMIVIKLNHEVVKNLSMKEVLLQNFCLSHVCTARQSCDVWTINDVPV